MSYIENGITKTVNVNESDSSYRYRSLMQHPKMVLKFSLPEYIDFGAHAFMVYDGTTFTASAAPDIKKNGERNIEYTFNMGTYEDNLLQYKMRNSVDGRLKYSMCSTPAEFVAEIVANLNARDGAGVWHVGDCIDTTPKTIEFNHTYVEAALAQVAEEFETEWEIVNHYIHLHTVKYNENAPLPLSYGKGNGFVPGVGRTTPSGEQPIKRLFVQGGSRNIDRSEYRAPYLLLPRGKTLKYDGDKFEGESGFQSSKAREYQSSDDGTYIERIDGTIAFNKEDSIDCSDLYPSRVGMVSSVVVADAARNFYDIVDSSIPSDLNYEDCLIEGETMTVIFQTGMLAGKEFDAKYIHSARKFEIVPVEIDGQTMPNDTFIPAVGDTYAVFGVMLPSAYICNNNAKSGASWDMFRQAVRYLYANEDPKFTFTGKLQAMWSRTNWATVGPKLVVGGYIHFSDTQFAPDGTDIRIIGIKDFLTDPYAPTIDISNSVSGKSVTTTLVQVGSQEVVIGEAFDNSVQFTKRRFRDVQQTMQMISEAMEGYSDAINPITVQTMALLVGDESLQYVFLNPSDPTQEMQLNVTYNQSTKRLSVPAAVLMHMTLGITTIMETHDETRPQWSMQELTSNVLTDGSKGYYLYAKCEIGSGSGEFVLSENAIGMEAVSGYYHFLVGILNTEIEGERSYVSLYGFTEVLPGRITTDKIVSNDGENWFDLVSGHIQANSAYIRGTIRSPFQNADSDSFSSLKYDNVITTSGGNQLVLGWDASQSGRKVVICGTGSIAAPPSGCYFFRDGYRFTNALSYSNELVSMVGYGTEDTFYGWVVTDRVSFYGNPQNYGSYLRGLFIGHVKIANNSGILYGAVFNGGSVGIARSGAGVYVLSVPSAWFKKYTILQTVDVESIYVVATSMSSGIVVAVTNKVEDTNNGVVNITIELTNNSGNGVDAPFDFIMYNGDQWSNWTILGQTN